MPLMMLNSSDDGDEGHRRRRVSSTTPKTLPSPIRTPEQIPEHPDKHIKSQASAAASQQSILGQDRSPFFLFLPQDTQAATASMSRLIRFTVHPLTGHRPLLHL